MKRSMLLLAPLAAALTFGAASALATPSANPFAGSWAGTWEDVTNAQEGTLELTISEQGVMSGVFYNETAGFGGDLNGVVHDDGDMHLVARSNGAGIFDGTVTLEGGVLSIDSTRKADDATILCSLPQ
jgi:hypothetical protein